MLRNLSRSTRSFNIISVYSYVTVDYPWGLAVYSYCTLASVLRLRLFFDFLDNY
jgi:hypothetical protein